MRTRAAWYASEPSASTRVALLAHAASWGTGLGSVLVCVSASWWLVVGDGVSGVVALNSISTAMLAACAVVNRAWDQGDRYWYHIV
jgi:hypothetical protein